MSNDDDELFRRAMSGAKPIKTESRVEPSARKPRPVAKFSREDEARVLDESLLSDIDTSEASAGAALRFHRPGIPSLGCNS